MTEDLNWPKPTKLLDLFAKSEGREAEETKKKERISKIIYFYYLYIK